MLFVVFDDMLSESLNLFKDDTLLNATKFVQLEINKVTSVKTCTKYYKIIKLCIL